MSGNITEKRWYPVLFMFAVSIFFSSIIIGFSFATEQKVKANEKIAIEQAVLKVLYGKLDIGLSGVEIHRQFKEKISGPDDSTGNAYVLRENGEIRGYAVPFGGRGFWAPIRGVIGVGTDRKTVSGIAFYENNETPGLGAEISQDPFCGQFKGKVLNVNGGKPIELKRPGSELGENGVHAVTGATQTCTRLEQIIDEALAQWRGKMK
ncbi:MAG: FMN-binding protein [Victivallales bacterium]|jgi:Na+-transporting NADH:ubiquinone oxidoreductase subunit C